MKNTELDFDWSALPAWANWIAMDQDGLWYWYYEKPELTGYAWVLWINSDVIPTEYEPQNFTDDWKDSLFEVPKNKKKGPLN